MRSNNLKIVIDADGCPVVQLTLQIADRFRIPCTLVCDTAHSFADMHAQIITVSQGTDSADFHIVNLIAPHDIVVTQDYGLAAMCLARGARALNQNGLIFCPQNMDSLLLSRHIHKKQRLAGKRIKGPKKRTAVQNAKFEEALIALLNQTNIN